MHYFAYGSNMSVQRLRSRVPSARMIASAMLDGYRLAFHKIGRDGSAKCDAARSAHQGAVVHGVVFELDPVHKCLLDEKEGLGAGYELTWVDVTLPDGRVLEAFMYFATHIDGRLRPYAWYREHVLRGAREHALPKAYIDVIAACDVVDDPDSERHRRELEIYL